MLIENMRSGGGKLIRVAVVDDQEDMLEAMVRQVGEGLREQALGFEVTAYLSGEALLKADKNFTIIFLDIQMKGISGMETAKRLRQKGVDSFLVFVTVLNEYVYDAFEVEATDYLLKPVDPQRLCRVLDRICRNIREREKKVLRISSKGNTYKSVPFDDLYYCEAVNHKVVIHAKGTVIDCHMKLEELEKRLEGFCFKCHRSYLVNPAMVCGYEDGLALLENGERIPVSRLRLQEFSEMMLRYMKQKGGA